MANINTRSDTGREVPIEGVRFMEIFAASFDAVFEVGRY
jgi:hypothetical protein